MLSSSSSSESSSDEESTQPQSQPEPQSSSPQARHRKSRPLQRIPQRPPSPSPPPKKPPSPHPPPPKSQPTPTPPPTTKKPGKNALSIVLDVMRGVFGILLVTALASYFITGDSISFNYRPWWSRPARLRHWITGPILLTPTQLSLYNGTDPTLPIYLAINSTIYDVSASPHTYGPTGSYHFFAGRDATRAYVTGCFSTDLTPDIRGVEEMFMPLDDPDEEEQISSRERKLRREKERRVAREMVKKSVGGWEKFFRNGKGGVYFEVGRVVDADEGEWGEVRELCENAQKGRKKRGEVKKEEGRGGRPAGVGA
ncbi:MAG: hypothetical protein M1834_006074 [Cirrosporium novae-zelandiae]|nr:MAG: hypothetical protein M1834_006074 [Cirrosporium novae-zelandiae]